MAVAMRVARWAEDDGFNDWLASLTGDEHEVQSTAIDPAEMRGEMPEIPVAGSGEEPDEDEPRLDGGPVGPDEPDGGGHEHQAGERTPLL